MVSSVTAPPRSNRVDFDAPTPRPSAPLRQVRQPESPLVIDDYELLEEIARGGMGIVFKAKQCSLSRIVALKMILAGQLAGEDDVRRFHAEAQAAAKLKHPGIVAIHEIGEAGGQPFFTMDFIDGESLSVRLSRGPLPPSRAAQLLVVIAEAIQHAHDRGVIHRDLKPANILLDTDGEPHITDFGLAKHSSAQERTVAGQMLGTPNYMSPEQAACKNDQVGPAADVYSLGALLYATLTGRPPFQAASPLDTVLQVLEQEPVWPRALNAHVPRDLEAITLKCLEKSPRARYASAQAFADDLRRFQNGESVTARQGDAWYRARRWLRKNVVVAGVSGTLALALTVLSCVALLAWSAEQRLRIDLETQLAELKGHEAASAAALRRHTTDRRESSRSTNQP